MIVRVLISQHAYSMLSRTQNLRNESGKNFQPSSEYKDPGEHFERVEFFDPRETPYIPINLPTHFKRQGKHKHQARGAAQAVRPPAYSERNHFAQDRREKPGRDDGRPNLKPSGSRERWIVMEGEAAFSLSQGDEEISSLHNSTLNSTTNTNSNNSTAQVKH